MDHEEVYLLKKFDIEHDHITIIDIFKDITEAYKIKLIDISNEVTNGKGKLVLYYDSGYSAVLGWNTENHDSPAIVYAIEKRWVK